MYFSGNGDMLDLSNSAFYNNTTMDGYPIINFYSLISYYSNMDGYPTSRPPF